MSFAPGANGNPGMTACALKYRPIGLLLVFAGVFAVYFQMFGLPYFISEYAEFYTWNLNMTPEKLLEAYNPMRMGWYRPSAQVLQYQAVAGIFGWHNIFAFQCVTMLTMLALAASVYFVAEKVTGSVTLAALAGLAGAIHPVMYILPADLIYFDALYQIALLWALYFFIESLERDKPKLTIRTALLFLFALTCKEQSLVFPFALFAFAAVYVSFNRRDFRKVVPQFAAVVALCAIAAFYTALRMKAMSTMDGPYRCGADWAQIVPNLLIGGLWIFRMFPTGTPAWDGVPRDLWASHDSRLWTALSHDFFRWHGMWNPLSVVVGIVAFALFAYAIVSTFRNGNRREKWILSSLLLCIPIFAAMPVYNGGRPWHFALPAIVVMIISAIGLGRFLEKIGATRWTVGISIFAGLVLAIASTHDFGKARVTRYSMNMVNLSALDYPPRPAGRIAPNASIYYVVDNGFWAFGNGHLFEWVYLRPDVKDMPIVSPECLTDADLKEIAEGRACYFYYDRDHHFWKDKTATVAEYYAKMRKSGVAIDFRGGGNADEYLGEGWYLQEYNGRWTKSSKAELRLPCMPAADMKMLFWADAYTPPTHPDQVMTVFFNDVQIGKIRIVRDKPRPQPISFDVPYHAIRVDSQKIVLKIADPAAPKDYDNSDDERELGFFAMEIDLVPKPDKNVFK